MSYDYDADDETQGPKALRDAIDKANKKIADLEKTNAELAKKASESTLSQIFTDKKVPANIQRWMKRDEVEASPEAVDKWLNENGSDFGWNPQAASTEKPEGEQVPAQEAPAVQQSVLTPEDIAAYQRVQAIAAAGNGQFTVSDQSDQAVAAAASVLTGGRDDFDNLMAAFKAQGIPVESSFG